MVRVEGNGEGVTKVRKFGKTCVFLLIPLSSSLVFRILVSSCLSPTCHFSVRKHLNKITVYREHIQINKAFYPRSIVR